MCGFILYAIILLTTMSPFRLYLGHKFAKIVGNILGQWFLTLLEVLNPASFIGAFTEPFVVGKIKYDIFFKNIGIYAALFNNNHI